MLTDEERSCTRDDNSSNRSSTTSRLFAELRELRHDSPTISTAATLKRNPSAIAFAPFSIALGRSEMSLVID